MPGGIDSLIAALVVSGLLLVLIGYFLVPILLLYMQARVTNTGITLERLIQMRLRKVDLRTVVYGKIRADRARLGISIDQIETLFHAGGDVHRVISALILAKESDIFLSWPHAMAVELAGFNIFAGVDYAIKAAKTDPRRLGPNPLPHWLDLSRARGFHEAAESLRREESGHPYPWE